MTLRELLALMAEIAGNHTDIDQPLDAETAKRMINAFAELALDIFDSLPEIR
jgi:hypothetical protein